MQVSQITLDNHEFEGENNVYLLQRDGDSVLIDTGVANDVVRSRLERVLENNGCEVSDIDAVLLTHWHTDHSGLAGWVQERSDAKIFVHEADASLVLRSSETNDAIHERRVETFESWGVPPGKRDELLELLNSTPDLFEAPDSVTEFRAPEQLTVGDIEINAIHTPGHTAGHCSFEVLGVGLKVLFVGDAVLPNYTPNIGGADIRLERPLETYCGTLNKISERQYDRLLPGHRGAIDDPAARIRTILDHHRDRIEKTAEVLRERGRADPWTVSAHLFGELEGIHILHGPGEAYAHLEHLVTLDYVDKSPDGYRLVEMPDTFDTMLSYD